VGIQDASRQPQPHLDRRGPGFLAREMRGHAQGNHVGTMSKAPCRGHDRRQARGLGLVGEEAESVDILIDCAAVGARFIQGNLVAEEMRGCEHALGGKEIAEVVGRFRPHRHPQLALPLIHGDRHAVGQHGEIHVAAVLGPRCPELGQQRGG